MSAEFKEVLAEKCHEMAESVVVERGPGKILLRYPDGRKINVTYCYSDGQGGIIPATKERDEAFAEKAWASLLNLLC